MAGAQNGPDYASIISRLFLSAMDPTTAVLRPAVASAGGGLADLVRRAYTVDPMTMAGEAATGFNPMSLYRAGFPQQQGPMASHGQAGLVPGHIPPGLQALAASHQTVPGQRNPLQQAVATPSPRPPLAALDFNQQLPINKGQQNVAPSGATNDTTPDPLPSSPNNYNNLPGGMQSSMAMPSPVSGQSPQNGAMLQPQGTPDLVSLIARLFGRR